MVSAASTRPKSGLAALLQHRSLLVNRRLADFRSRGRKWQETTAGTRALYARAPCLCLFYSDTLEFLFSNLSKG